MDKQEYIILYCGRDHIWLVARRTARTNYIYKTIAECFTETSALILYKKLNKLNFKNEKEN